MSRLVQPLELLYSLIKIRFFNTLSNNATNMYDTKRCLHDSIYSSICVEMMPMLAHSIHQVETSFFKTKRERLDRISQLGFHEFENLNIRNHTSGINSSHHSDRLSQHQDLRFICLTVCLLSMPL